MEGVRLGVLVVIPCSGAHAARLAEGPCTLVPRQTLAVLEFDSTRKRQSVIVRVPDGRILLYCKARPLPLDRLSRQGRQAASTSTALDFGCKDFNYRHVISRADADDMRQGRPLHLACLLRDILQQRKAPFSLMCCPHSA